MTENTDTTTDTSTTDTTTTDTTPDATAEQSTEPSTAEQVEQQPEQQEKTGNREAAKYRTRLRETEAERDQLRTTLEEYRRREVVRLAEDHGLLNGSDLLDLGLDLAEVTGEDGTIDPEAVAARVADVLAERPHWRRPSAPPRFMPVTTLRPGASPSPSTEAPKTWQQVLRG